jgi:hypothetical protein
MACSNAGGRKSNRLLMLSIIIRHAKFFSACVVIYIISSVITQNKEKKGKKWVPEPGCI